VGGCRSLPPKIQGLLRISLPLKFAARAISANADASKPDEYALALTMCAKRSYLVKLIPHRAAKVERVGQ
jgi:hypothetical protein